VTSDLKIEEHLNKVLSSAAASIYALETLRSHGLTGKALQEVTRATTMAQVMYASPAWWGYRAYKSKRSRETRKISRKTETPRFPNEGRHGHFPKSE